MNFVAPIVLCLLMSFSLFADDGWKLVSGEISILAQIKGKIDRNNLRMVLSYNTASGEVRYLKSTFTGNRSIKDELVTIREPQQSEGGYEIIFSEHTLITGVTDEDVDGESFFCPFLLEKRTGKMWRLMATAFDKKNLKLTWNEVPSPASLAQGDWIVSTFEHSILRISFHRQNLYSLYLTEKSSGTMYKVDSYYNADAGKIFDKVVEIPQQYKAPVLLK
jgi:hypothetical protein